MKIKILCGLGVACAATLFCTLDMAGGPDLVSVPVQVSPWYISIGGGYAWGTQANIRINHTPSSDNFAWAHTVQTYNSSLDNSPFVTLAVGRHIAQWLSAEISSSYFNDFRYQKVQNILDLGLPPVVQRKFELSNFNVVFNLIASPDQFSANFWHGTLTPFIGAGIGPSLNTVNNFIDINNTGATDLSGTSNTHELSLALQAEAGLSFVLSAKTMVDVGYRYYYGGNFKTPGTLLANGVVTSVHPWKGTLNAHLLFADVRFAA